MNRNNIYILSGTIQTGKSTGLLKWSKNNMSVKGIVQYHKNGKRVIYDIESKEEKNLEVENPIDNSNIVKVGKYSFNNATFIWARQKLLQAFKQNPGWLIIDEYGKLEINNLGLEPAITQIISKSEKENKTKLLIVIRDTLKNDFIKKFNLNISNINYFEYK